MIAALDTNVLAYAEGLGDLDQREQARSLLRELADQLVLPAQVLGELYNVLTKKGHSARGAARAITVAWSGTLRVIEPPAQLMFLALDLAAERHLGIWDAAMLAASQAAGCSLFLTEDLQDGLRWRGLEVVNPFLPGRRGGLHARLDR